jgi:iron complex outermembrane recepter protein
MVRREWGTLRAVSQCSAAVAALLASPGGAWAQATGPDAKAANNDAGILQEVVVTAERRAADIQSTPISVAAVSGSQLAEQQINSVQALQTAVPNFTVNDEGGEFESYNIRGVGNTAITPSITTGVAVFRDGLLLSETIGQNEPLYDIRDVEVLRGPQGTFVGASSTGGAVQINSQDPNFGGLNGYGEVQVGNYTAHKVDGALNMPISDTLAARLAFNWDERHSFYRDIGAQQTSGTEPMIDPAHFDARDFRVGLLWKPTDEFQALLKVEYNEIDQGGDGGSPAQTTYQTLFNNGGPGNPLCPVTPIAGGTVQTCPQPGTTTYSQYYAYSTHVPYLLNYATTNYAYTDVQNRYGLELRYTLPGDIVLRSLTGYQHFDIHNIGNQGRSAANAGDTYQEIGPDDDYYSEELNLLSPTNGKVNWIAGAFWYYRKTPVLNTIYNVGPPYGVYQAPATVVYVPYASVQRLGALFGQLNWHMTDTLELQVGIRENWDYLYNYDEPPGPGQPSSGVYFYPANATSTPLAVIGATEAPYKDKVPTGKVGLNWTPFDGQYFYAFYARGYKAGGVVVSIAKNPATFEPEHVNDFELGWKGTFLDGHLQTQLGGYYMNYQNMQYPLFDINTAAGLNVNNLAASTIKGIEFSMQSRFAGLGISLGLAYNDSSLGAVTGLPNYRLPAGFNAPIAHVQCGSPSQTPLAPCFNYLPYLETVSGEQNPFSPKVTGNISVDYSIPLASGVLDPRITYSYTDKQWVSIFQDSPYNLLESRRLLGANLDYVSGPWTVSLYGTNLTNQTYLSGTDGTNNVYYGAPRQFGLRLMRTF